MEKGNSVLFLYFFTFLKQVLHVVFFFFLTFKSFLLIMSTLTIKKIIKKLLLLYILILYFSFCQFSKRTYNFYFFYFLEMIAISLTYNLSNLYLNCSPAKIGVQHQSINQSIIYLALFNFTALLEDNFHVLHIFIWISV
jgi:hypothetical protein